MLPQSLLVNSIYSTKQISQTLLSELQTILKDLDYGSVELFVTNNIVTQITKRQIKKTTSDNKKY